MPMANVSRAGLRDAVVLAAAGALAQGLVAHILWSLYGGPSVLEIVGAAAGMFVVVLGALVLGGARGLALLWGVLLVMWLMSSGGMLLAEENAVWFAFRYLPDAFTAWNLHALPLGVVTALLLHGTGRARTRALLGVMGVWVVLALPSAAVSRDTPDTGGGPRSDPRIAWPMNLLLPAAPLVLGGWMILRLRRHDPRPAPVRVSAG
jgi:hypothetical protein